MEPRPLSTLGSPSENHYVSSGFKEVPSEEDSISTPRASGALDPHQLERAYGADDATRRLEEIETIKFGWTQIRACLIAGSGFFTDAYDLFIINQASSMMAYVYYGESTLPKDWDLGVKVATQVGTMFGQLVFGWLGDHYGRQRIYGIELMIIIIGTIGSALSASAVHGFSVLTTLVIMRFIVGFGIGGDYPLSAVITSEYSSTRHRGAMMSAVFAMQGFGILASAIVSAIMVVAFKSAINNDIRNLDLAWRLCLGIGAIPGIITIYYRLTMKETPRYEIDQAKALQAQLDEINMKKVISASAAHGDPEKDMLTTDEMSNYWSDFRAHYRKWSNLKILVACSVCWFSLDVAFYGINLNNGVILDAIGYSSSDNPYENLHQASIGNIIINLMGTVPGYWFTVFLIERLGRKFIQIMGFSILVVIFIILGFAYHPILDASVALFIVFFTLAQFFQNFGPNATTFVYPGEVFPTRFRSTSHGISAASGKLGAIVAQAGFSQLKDIGGKNAFVPHIIKILSAFMLVGLVFTFLLPETKGRTLEEITGENEESEVQKDAAESSPRA
ncbi:phosphate transporter [Dimargaris cristalligena]|uniref:Phosphate transporter n=1 Tax=Dimargaris cristalligena TaxID=215637 RepID=A0A4P9ZZ72_9FUNG|nr:phosphate transporter [Dimargaris cristalligena]|eukprot:RKP39013.1 phosphate transporter [Dimargaris cristalligena]